MEGKYLYNNINNINKNDNYLAMRIYGKDWKRVEMHIGTRSGAQIRSHA